MADETDKEQEKQLDKDEDGVPLKNRLEEMKRKNKKLADDLEVGKNELTRLSAEVGGLKSLLSTFQKSTEPAKPEPNKEEVTRAFWEDPVAMTQSLIKETVAKELLPSVKKVVEDGLTSFTESSRQEQEKIQANHRALSKYPGLMNTDSEFYQETKLEVERLASRPGLAKDPELIEIAADKVALKRPDLVRKFAEDYPAFSPLNPIEVGGFSRQTKKKKSMEPNELDKETAESFNRVLKEYNIAITPEKISEHRKLAIQNNPKLRLYMKEES